MVVRPVVGLDVAKGAPEGQAFLDNGQPPTMVLESMGHDHIPIVRFLEEYGYAYVLLNPLIPGEAVREVKTDAVDAYRWGNLFDKEELATFPAAQAVLSATDVPHQAFSLRMYIHMIGEYQAHIKALDDEITGLAQDIEACHLIQSIPGIGSTVAATITAEIGEITRFENARKRAAFAGVDPRVHESGQFKATMNRIAKRGTPAYAMPCFWWCCVAYGRSEANNCRPSTTPNGRPGNRTKWPWWPASTSSYAGFIRS